MLLLVQLVVALYDALMTIRNHNALCRGVSAYHDVYVVTYASAIRGVIVITKDC
jgi:drug/metabolite transporter superfamily protein YnfA